MHDHVRSPLISAVALLLLGAASAQAQPLGTFRWQFAPYCNVVSLLVEQKGGTYELTGYDDQCGGPKLAPARGTAHINPDGSATLGIGITRLDGIHVATNATIAIAGLSGTWADDKGNNGTFVYNPPAAPGGDKRPLRYSGTYTIGSSADSPADWATGHVAFPHRLADVPIAVAANVINEGEAPTTNCPGSAASPVAAIGHLCLYEHRNDNLTTLCMARSNPTWACNNADKTGFSLFGLSIAAGDFASVGAWALTVP